MKKLLYIIVALLPFYSSAQSSSIAVGCKREDGKLVVQLKFMFPDKVISDMDLNVYRKAGGGWEKINDAPVKRAGLSESYKDDAYKYYVGFMKRKPEADPRDEQNAIAFGGIFVIRNNDFARYAGCYFEDVTAVEGNTYQYRITTASGEKELVVSQPFTVKQNYLPAVSNLTLKQKDENVKINWSKNKAFYAYNVYRKTKATGKGTALTPEPMLLGKMSGSGLKDISDEVKHVDSSLSEGSSYYYEVTGIDVLGNESQPGEAIKIDIEDMVAPEAVTEVKAKKRDGSAIVSWEASKGDDVKGFNIYRNSTNDTVYKKITSSLLSANASTYTDKELKEGSVYGYKVEAVDKAGNGTLSRQAKVFFPDQTPPAKPTGLKAVSKPGTIQLTWDKNKEGDLKGYFIYRASTRDKAYFNMLYKDPMVANSFNDTLPGVARNEFIYYIQAVDKNYNVSLPSDTVVVTLPDTAAPHRPVITSIDLENGTAILNVSLGDDDAVGYNVFRLGDSSGKEYTKVNRDVITAKTYADKIELKGMGYHYYVVAVDKAGNNSVPSSKMSVYADADVVALVAAQNLNAKFNSRDTAIDLSWTNTAKSIAGYIVYRKEDNGGSKSVSGLLKDTKFSDATVEVGSKFRYMVRTIFDGTDMTANSAELEVQTY